MTGDLRPLIDRCLAGEQSPAITLLHLVMASADLDEIGRAIAGRPPPAEASRAARLRALADLLAANREGAALVAALLRDGMDHRHAAKSADDGIDLCRTAFDRMVQRSAEASVALYSFGNPALLEAATAEVVGRMRDWGLVGGDRHLLEIGCGIGRFEAALAAEVATATGIDISANMIDAARQRCAGLANVRFLHCTGRDLSPFADASVDLVFAVDSFPYLVQAGLDLADRHVAEAARVLRPGGALLILNFSYRGDFAADRADVARLAAANGFTAVRNGTADFALWNGHTFLLVRRPGGNIAG